MSDNVDKIRTMLTEEKWTRSTIANYTITSFQELDEFLMTVDKDDEHEIKQICDDHLAHTKNSIMALYISVCYLSPGIRLMTQACCSSWSCSKKIRNGTLSSFSAKKSLRTTKAAMRSAP
jgi:hypothetical protein